MLELVEFPHLPGGDPKKAVSALIKLCREMPSQGEQFRFFRRRMKDLRLWDDNLLSGTLAFLAMEKTGTMRPSQFARKVGGIKSEDKARALLTERLWEVNPLLCKAIIEYLNERVYSRDELIKYVDSFAYRGKKPSRPQLEAWLHLALGLQVLKMVGIALDLDERGRGLLERASELDVDEFLEDMAADDGDADGDQGDGGDDDDESGHLDDGNAAPAGAGPAEAQGHAAEARAGGAEAAHGPSAATGARGAATSAGPAAAAGMDVSALSSARGREHPVNVTRFAGQVLFPPDVLDESAARIQAWWSEQSSERQGLSAADFGFEPEAWMEHPDELLFRIAVAAALVFRLNRDRAGIEHAFEALDASGVLRDLYYGTAPDVLPSGIDAQGLMLASLLARRFAETPELAATLDQQASASDTFAVLEQALGRGLLRIEIFWMIGALSELGALRLPDLADYTALPRRLVRDTLYRLGFIDSPYAHDPASLVPAARAARRAAGPVAPPDEVLMAFALTAGCAYDCPHRRQCEHACRERAE